MRAKVIRLSGPRSYDVLSEDGRLMRRNRQHLMTTRGLFTSAPTDFSGVSHNAEQPTTVPTSTAIETSSNAVPCATETVAELPSTTSSPLVERRSERVRSEFGKLPCDLTCNRDLSHQDIRTIILL